MVKFNFRFFIQFFSYYIIPGLIFISFLYDMINGLDVYEKVEAYGFLSWALIYLILLIKPLATLTKLKFFKTSLSYRRELGVLSFWFAFFHSVVLLFYLDLLNPERLIILFDISKIYFWGLIAFIGMFILGVTSNRLSLMKLKGNWKKLHLIVFPTFLFATIHFAMAQKDIVPYFLISFLFILKVVEYVILRKRKSV